MTISSSLNAGVAGLNANANRLSTIADNIANSATYGYRRATTDFHSVVLNGAGNLAYAAGGVRVSNMRLIDDRGPLIGTSNPTDIAIDGRGFLAVTDIVSVSETTGDYPISLSTTGSFRPDANGILVSDTGQVLMGWPANRDGTIPTYPRDSMSALEPVRINPNQYTANPTTTLRMGINLPATSTIAGAADGPRQVPVEYFTSLGTSETLDFTFTPVVPATGPASNQWTMLVTDSASAGAVIGEYTLTFDPSSQAGGTLASVAVVSGGTYDAATGKMSLPAGGGGITLDIGRTGEPNGITQLSNNFAPVGISKDGSAVATLTSVEVDSQGNLYALYDQGFSRRIYQLPVIDVPNPSGLVSMTNQTYQVSPASGAYYLWDAGDGPTGAVAGFARQESATDVAAELTQLIQTQRAYSSNAKIIQTVDEMLQETISIKR